MSVVATALSPTHVFSKTTTKPSEGILFVAGYGVNGDCHAGEFVQHRSRLKIRPKPANLRQVHLIPLEILKERDLEPARIGENITTEGIPLLELGVGDRLIFVPEDAQVEGEKLDADGEGMPEEADEDLRDQIALDSQNEGAIVKITGLRNPCPQIDKYRAGLRETFLVRDEERNIIGRLAGIMSTVESGGWVRPGMKITVQKASGEFVPLPQV